MPAVVDISLLSEIHQPPATASIALVTVADWFEYAAPDFRQGNISLIAGARKLIAAKAALKKSKGSFGRLVEALGMDLDKAERLMTIARHPVLGDSAHARSLPLSWMTQFTLAKLPPKDLLAFIANGMVHPALERKEAERLVQKARGSNSNGGHDRDRSRVEQGDDDHSDGRRAERGDVDNQGAAHDAGSSGDHQHAGDDVGGSDPKVRDEARPEPSAGQGNGAPTQDVGPDSEGEVARKLARLEELEREARQWAIQRHGWESENQELKVKLNETAIRHQRRLFRQVMGAMQKAEAADLPAKEKRALHNSVIIDLTEFVRSAARDGLRLDHFDLFYRAEEVH